MRGKDLIGQKFNRLTVVEKIKIDGRSDAYWRCICDCGQETIQSTYILNKGIVKSCGCYKKEIDKTKFLKGFEKILTKNYLEEEYVNKKRSLRNIGKEINCSATCVKKYLTKHDIPVFNRLYDILNKRFGKLIVIKRLPNKNTRQSRWLCQCDCGNQKEIHGYFLVRGATKSCGCYKKQTANFLGFNNLSGKYWGRIKRKALERNLTFNINIEDAWNIFEKQKNKCALSGLPIFLSRNISLKKQTASLDRIDSTKGYELNNIQWVHVDINKLKNNFPEEKLFFLCNQIVKNQNINY